MRFLSQRSIIDLETFRAVYIAGGIVE
jgi:hypothetical protein